jgi:hypothetical protein
MSERTNLRSPSPSLTPPHSCTFRESGNPSLWPCSCLTIEFLSEVLLPAVFICHLAGVYGILSLKLSTKKLADDPPPNGWGLASPCKRIRRSTPPLVLLIIDNVSAALYARIDAFLISSGFTGRVEPSFTLAQISLRSSAGWLCAPCTRARNRPE